ncbi:MAG: hypothetical protein KF819_40010 [Labilithrix sp.]|nr:hypothetical protein [Labilithrix sp.]
MDPEVHQRYLDYRDRHGYFGRSGKLLGAAEFVALDAEHAELDAKGERRDDEEEARFAEVSKILFRD